MTQEYIATGTLAKLYGVRVNTVINWIKAGKIEGIKTPGGSYRIKIDQEKLKEITQDGKAIRV